MTPAGRPPDVEEAFDAFPLNLITLEGPERILTASAHMRAFFGVPDPVGRLLAEVAPGLAGQEILELMQRCFDTGEPIRKSRWRLHLHPDDPESEAFFFSFVVVPWQRPGNRAQALLAYAVDVTAEALQERDAEARASGAERQLAQARDVVLELQRNLLPAAVPILPRVRLAAQYVVAAAELQAGGDWFDAVPRGSGRVALVVGDVVGHGAAAAAAMAQLRTVLHEALLSGVPIPDAVDRLDRFAATAPAMRAATVCVAELDPGAGTVSWTARAHPPPLVCGPDGGTRYLGDGAGPPLGVGGGTTTLASATLAPGELVMLYSDGLVERPGEAYDEGLERVARIAGAAVGTRGRTVPTSAADRVCTLTVERVTREAHGDDVTVVVAHLLPDAPAPLELDLPATTGSLAEVRERVTSWLGGLGAYEQDTLAATVAAYEAAANVADHAYAGRSQGRAGRLRLRAHLADDGRVTVVVADDGAWREGGSAGGGRGLALIHAYTDADVDRAPGGTTVTMRRRLEHPAVVGTVEPAVAAEVGLDTVAFEVAVTRHDPTVVSVRGPVDAGTVGVLRTEIARHAAQPVVLDLAGVTFLASAGVQLLHELDAHGRLRRYAPAGTPAQQVLALVGLATEP